MPPLTTRLVCLAVSRDVRSLAVFGCRYVPGGLGWWALTGSPWHWSPAVRLCALVSPRAPRGSQRGCRPPCFLKQSLDSPCSLPQSQQPPWQHPEQLPPWFPTPSRPAPPFPLPPAHQPCLTELQPDLQTYWRFLPPDMSPGCFPNLQSPLPQHPSAKPSELNPHPTSPRKASPSTSLDLCLP